MSLTFAIEVVYALPHQQWLVTVQVSQGTTVGQALAQADLASHVGNDDYQPSGVVGIFGQIVPLTHCLQAGDRVEIYRPLHCDPRQARWQRAEDNR